MIGKISGIVDYRGDDHVLIDVRGVGYIIYCSDRTLARLPRAGEAATLYTDLLVREDLLQLFGFTSLVEKEWHRLLVGVQGIGAKGALAILGTLGVDGLSRAIALGDDSAIKRAKGVGPKTAQRVVIELKDKAPSLMAMASAPVATADADLVIDDTPAAPKPRKSTKPAEDTGDLAAQADALSALGNLGYAPSDAAAAVAQATADTPGMDSAGVIRAALKLLAPKG